MPHAVLIVEQDDVRRAQLRAAFTARSVPVYEVADAVDAMVAIGRADFGALVASTGRRQLSLRGLCLLARRRHEGIRIVVLASDGDDIEQQLGLPVDVLPQDVHAREIVDAVLVAAPALLSPFDAPAPTEKYEAPPSQAKTDSGGVPLARHLADAVTVRVAALREPEEQSDETTGKERPAPAGEFAEPTILDDRADAISVESLDDVAAAEPAEPTLVDLRAVFVDLLVSGTDPPTQVDPVRSLRAPPGFTDPPDTLVTGRGSDTSELALFEGELEPSSTAALLMGIFAQELTGRLEIGPRSSSEVTYFFAGDPVGVGYRGGDAALYAALVERGVLSPRVVQPFVDEGQLLSAFVADGILTGEAISDFLRTTLEERIEGIIEAAEGPYRFVEERRFLATLPLTRVSPFAALLSLLERRHGPELLVEAARLSRCWLVPLPLLAICETRLRPFANGAALTEALTRGEAREVLEQLGLDEHDAALLVLGLARARLVEIHDVPPQTLGTSTNVAIDTTPTLEVPHVPESVGSDEVLSDDERQLREEIFTLYMRLKPLTRPAQVLGLPLSATLHDVESALRARLQQLDPDRIPEGPSRAVLLSRVEELRAKVTRAYEALRLQIEATGRNPPARNDDDSNPW